MSNLKTKWNAAGQARQVGWFGLFFSFIPLVFLAHALYIADNNPIYWMFSFFWALVSLVSFITIGISSLLYVLKIGQYNIDAKGEKIK